MAVKPRDQLRQMALAIRGAQDEDVEVLEQRLLDVFRWFLNEHTTIAADGTRIVHVGRMGRHAKAIGELK